MTLGVHALLERAVARAAEDQARLLAARTRWKALAGEVFDDEPLYEERTTAFLEWFTLEWRGAGPGTGLRDDAGAGSRDDAGAGSGDGPDGADAPPIARAIAAAVEAGDEATRAALSALAAAHRSIFVVRAHQPDGEGTAVVVEDLWGGATFHVHERRRLIGLDPGELFEARLVADPAAPPRLWFSRGLCFHPREALGAVRAQIARARAAGESRTDLLFRLLRLRLKCERYRHVAPARVYAEPGG